LGFKYSIYSLKGLPKILKRAGMNLKLKIMKSIKTTLAVLLFAAVTRSRIFCKKNTPNNPSQAKITKSAQFILFAPKLQYSFAFFWQEYGTSFRNRVTNRNNCGYYIKGSIYQSGMGFIQI
jgi:hypothetical protein